VGGGTGVDLRFLVEGFVDDVFCGDGGEADFFVGGAGGVGAGGAGGGPVDGVGEDAADFGLVVGGEGFVAGAEVDDFAFAAGPGAAGAEDVTAFEPGDHDEFVGGGDVEEFAVHFFVGDVEVFGEAVGDFVGGVDDPEAFELAGLAPFEAAAGAHEFAEGLGEVGGVEKDDAHTFEDALVDFGGDFVADIVVGHVAPPGHDVGVGEEFVGEAVVGGVEDGGADLDLVAEVFGDGGGQDVVHAVGVDFADGFVADFVAELVPDGDAEGGGAGRGHFGTLFRANFAALTRR
jgi:hypothetical protein